MSSKLICPKCGNGQLMSIIKAIPKGNSLVLANRCPKCKTTTKIILDLTKKDEWIDDVSHAFFTCDVCGAINKDNIIGLTYPPTNPYAYWYYYGGRKKITFKCNSCGRLRVKATTIRFWDDLIRYSQLDKEKKEELVEKVEEKQELHCPSCGKTISEEDKICPHCGIELKCDKCGAPILPGSNFCSNCGDRVEKFEVKKEVPPQERVCPACHESVSEEEIFCHRCGQELKCDKCGAELPEGASFCRECGDPVTPGEVDQ
ncbi:MAG: zinc ribbon domain-containing protein [Candidatus Helarchaeota archaeon]